MLVSNHAGLSADTRVRVTVPVGVKSPVWDPDEGKRVAQLALGGSLELTLGALGAPLFYVGSKHADALSRRHD